LFAGFVEADLRPFRIKRALVDIERDMTQPETAGELVERTRAEFGRADLLVNRVGMLRTTPLEEIPLEEWDELLRVNLTAVCLCCQAFLPVMRAQRSGRTISWPRWRARWGCSPEPTMPQRRQGSSP
jgi:3-oxoacyl-[acyl-carrier protein] reductase